MPAYFDKNKKSWYVKFWYKDYDGTRRQTTKRGFKLKKDAVKYEADFKNEKAGSLHIPFSSLAARYLIHLKTNVRKMSYDHAVNQLELHILPYFKDIPVSQITVKTIMDWHDNYLKKTGFKPPTLKTINGRLSAVFNFAVKYYHLQSNPVPAAGVMGSTRTDREYAVWTLEEFSKFIDAVQHSRAKYASIVFQLLYFTGMRPCELLGLSLEDVDTEHGIISVNKSYHYDTTVEGELYHGYFTEPKNNYSKRKIMLPPFLTTALTEYVIDCKRLGMTKRIFPTNTQRLNGILNLYSQKAGLKKIRLYDLRHSHASMLISSHQDITLVAQRMGHCSPDTTLRIYTHQYKDNSNELVGFLQKNGEKINNAENCGQNVVNSKKDAI